MIVSLSQGSARGVEVARFCLGGAHMVKHPCSGFVILEAAGNFERRFEQSLRLLLLTPLGLQYGGRRCRL
ncbi:MAG: hypothetical protein IIB67_02285 [Proteobacteria bacterium]|nr:hypothetical protein [Pseudomonadota bacterium]